MIRDMENFMIYLTQLVKSLPSFQKRIDEIRDKYKCYPSKSMLTNNVEDMGDVEELMKDFFIPINGDYLNEICAYIYYGEITNKFLVRDCRDASRESPREFFLNRPSITIHIFEKMGERAWRDIWSKYIKVDHPDMDRGDNIEGPPFLEKLDREDPNRMSIESLKTPFGDIKKRPTFPLLFEIYKERKKGVSMDDVMNDMWNIKKKSGVDENIVYTEDEVNKMMKDFTELIESL